MNIIPNKEYVVQITGLTTDLRKTNTLKENFTNFVPTDVS